MRGLALHFAATSFGGMGWPESGRRSISARDLRCLIGGLIADQRRPSASGPSAGTPARGHQELWLCSMTASPSQTIRPESAMIPLRQKLPHGIAGQVGASSGDRAPFLKFGPLRIERVCPVAYRESGPSNPGDVFFRFAPHMSSMPAWLREKNPRPPRHRRASGGGRAPS